ncbi:hypothetical protein OCUBac02_37380 [Bosea sp. ANAM02]|nr:hypothetical protein OCUBac02_37380 [Bosea sp. ANAM02]
MARQRTSGQLWSGLADDDVQSTADAIATIMITFRIVSLRASAKIRSGRIVGARDNDVDYTIPQIWHVRYGS